MSAHTLERTTPEGRTGAVGRRGAAFLLAGSLLGLGVAAAPAAAAPARDRERAVPLVVVTAPGTSARAAVLSAGGRVTRELRLVHGVAARVPESALGTLRASAGVRLAVRDRTFHARGAETGADAGMTLRHVRAVIDAETLGPAASGSPRVDVAVVDTGVAPVPGLAGGKVVDGPDFSSDGRVAGQAHLDAFGHGTHMAGIIGADDVPGRFAGLAPTARIVNVRVGDHKGDTSLSGLLAGIDWTVRNRDRGGLDIRVLNLAFGAPTQGSYRTDPLAFAVEQAWRKGIVVVVAAGNGGAAAGGLDSPAYDPYVIAAGAQDTLATDTLADDELADFSSLGTAARPPDVLAPGVGIVSLRVPGGFLDTEFPGARIGEGWFRGSGTSQAAAVVSGAVALLLERRPDLDPDQVKALLRGTARALPGTDVRGQGAGVIDVAAAVAAPASAARQAWPHAAASGPWRGRGVIGLQFVAERNGGADWSSRRWSGDDWSSRRWSGDDWSSRRWSGDDWSSRRWSGEDWTSRRWSGFAWEPVTP